MYSLTNRVSRHMKQKLRELKEDMNECTLQLETSTPYTQQQIQPLVRINKDEELNNTSSTNRIQTTLHSTITGYTFISRAHRTYSKIDYILSPKTHLNKIKRIEIAKSMFFNHNGIKLEISNKKKSEKSPNTQKLMQIILGSKRNPQRKFKNVLNIMKMKTQLIKIYITQLKQCGEGNV